MAELIRQTVQTIACIAGNQSKDKKCKTTLIIAPLAVLTQSVAVLLCSCLAARVHEKVLAS